MSRVIVRLSTMLQLRSYPSRDKYCSLASPGILCRTDSSITRQRSRLIRWTYLELSNLSTLFVVTIPPSLFLLTSCHSCGSVVNSFQNLHTRAESNSSVNERKVNICMIISSGKSFIFRESWRRYTKPIYYWFAAAINIDTPTQSTIFLLFFIQN